MPTGGIGGAFGYHEFRVRWPIRTIRNGSCSGDWVADGFDPMFFDPAVTTTLLRRFC